MSRSRYVLSQSQEEENDLFSNSYLSGEVANNENNAAYKQIADGGLDEDSVKKSVRLNNDQSSYTPSNLRASLTWKNVSAKLASTAMGGEPGKQLLRSVSGAARPGELLAIMGESGAGKTTLLNIVGGRSTSSAIEVDGSVQANGEPLTIDLVRRFVGFVHQEDILPALLTVREYLWFNAKLRMVKPHTTDKEREARVDALLMELNLSKCANTVIGDPEQGMKTLSGGERKRLSLAVELIVNPALLFLDEPTSGLDSFLAETVVLALKSLAKQAGKTVVFTVHQPSSELFSFFDRLLLMAEGQVCFHGSVADASRFFAAPPISQPCPQDFNPADFYMDVICRRFRGEEQLKIMTDAYQTSNYAEIVTAEVEMVELRKKLNANESMTSPDRAGNETAPQSASIRTQVAMCVWRAAKCYYRSPVWINMRILETLTYPIIIGLCFLNLGIDPIGVANRCGLAVQITGQNAWSNIDQYVDSLPAERPMLLRECAAGLYAPWVYFVGRQTVELPFMFLLTLVGTTIIYVLPFMWTTTGAFGWIVAVATGYLVALVASSIGYIFGFMTENRSIIQTVGRPILVAMVLCNGFWINFGSIPPYLRWVSYLSMFMYGNENLFIGEWANVTLPQCNQPIDDSSNPANEIRCFENGAEVLQYYNFNAQDLGRNFGILIGLTIAFRLIAVSVLTIRTWRAITPRTK